MSNRGNTLLGIDRLVSEVVDSAHTAPDREMLSDADRHNVQLILNGDHRRQLKRQFSLQELRGILKAMRLSVPSLNQAQFRCENLDQLDRIAARLGARFVAPRFPGREGLGLLGFYIDEQRPAQRPLICVNSAHHPVAIAAAFWHEVGHHLATRLIGEQQGAVNLSLKAEYHKHLEQPFELLADMLVCLAGYPKRTAQRLFGRSAESDGSSADRVWEEILRKARRHLRTETGFEFRRTLPAAQNLHYLAGMIHFTKLRMALLSEYDL
jgi:hypothetical protein